MSSAAQEPIIQSAADTGAADTAVPQELSQDPLQSAAADTGAGVAGAGVAGAGVAGAAAPQELSQVPLQSAAADTNVAADVQDAPPAAAPQEPSPSVANDPPPAAADAPLTNIIILRDTGRDHGPDFALDNDKLSFVTESTGIDNNNSITEVLNKLAFLCNTTRDGTKINGKHSIDKTKYGAHDPTTGMYTQAGNGAEGGTLFGSTAAKGHLFDLNTMTAVAAADGAVIPQGLLKRTGDNSELYDAAAPIPVTSTEQINGVMRDCITQMVTILENTREVFGPKGWTALFKNVVGGGGGGDVKKRTRRRHRHGYSSKKY